MAIGQVPADFPEGFATIANLKGVVRSRSKRILLNASFLIPVFVGATAGYWLLRDRPEIYKLSVLAFTAGILMTMVVEELIPEAHEENESRWAAASLLGGFVLFTFLSVYLG